MYILECKQLYIVPTEQTKNRTCQSYRWKQIAMCKDIKPLQDIIDTQKDKTKWRISTNCVEV